MAPPQAMQPPQVSTTRRICASSRSTGASIAMVSAVPAAEVIAREDVLGIVRPSSAAIATTMGVVRLPASPPMQCLSTTSGCRQRSCAPVCTMAFVSATTSPRLRRSPPPAVMNAAISMEEYRFPTMSWMIPCSAGPSSSLP